MISYTNRKTRGILRRVHFHLEDSDDLNSRLLKQAIAAKSLSFPGVTAVRCQRGEKFTEIELCTGR